MLLAHKFASNFGHSVLVNLSKELQSHRIEGTSIKRDRTIERVKSRSPDRMDLFVALYFSGLLTLFFLVRKLWNVPKNDLIYIDYAYGILLVFSFFGLFMYFSAEIYRYGRFCKDHLTNPTIRLKGNPTSLLLKWDRYSMGVSLFGAAMAFSIWGFIAEFLIFNPKYL